MKNIFGKIIASFAFVACTSVAQAATITVDPLAANVTDGDVFTIKIVGSGFDAGTIGGGFSITWDSSIVTLQSSALTFAGDQTFGTPGVITVGSWANADVASLNGVAGPDFDIASLTFLAANPGVSPTDVVIGVFSGGSDRIWADATGFVDTNPSFVGGSITVNPVPVPAAVWLFGSGILGLIGVARRRNVTQAA